MTKGVAVRLCGHKQGLDAFFKGLWEKGQGRGRLEPDAAEEGKAEKMGGTQPRGRSRSAGLAGGRVGLALRSQPYLCVSPGSLEEQNPWDICRFTERDSS